MGQTNLSWQFDGPDPEEFRVYRADAPMDPGALPTPLATAISGALRSYVDSTVVKGNTYYYRVSAVKGSVEKVSAELEHEAVGDPLYAYVVSLLNMEGADGSTSFMDRTGKTWTAFGDAQIDTSLGYNAAQFDGSGDYISTPHSADLVLGADDFCVEGFARVSDISSQQTLLEKRGTGFAAGDWVVFIYSNRVVVYSYDVNRAGNIILSSVNGDIASNTEFHWAWTRSGSTMRLFINGIQRDTTTSAASIASSSTPLTIGRDNVGGRFWLNGRVRANRITKGAARYTANFTPPKAPFPYG